MSRFMVWNLKDDVSKYEKYLKGCVDVTPYHLTEYLLAEEEAEDGNTKVFLEEDGEKFTLFVGVVRTINHLPYMCGLKEVMYDMITPHEYGGIISNDFSDVLKKKLLESVSLYCRENNIIFQFVRMNPFLNRLSDIYEESGFEVIHSNSQVYVDLAKTKDEIVSCYKSNVRRNIKRAVQEKLTFEITDKTFENVAIFYRMYQNAMEILGARRFLYFNETYFHKLLACGCSKLGTVSDEEGRIIAAGILLLGGKNVYYHLGCFDRCYTLKRPMNYLMHAMILWSKDMGYEKFHLGGGSKSLMQFKGGYSDTRIDYYIANQICIPDRYQALCNRWRKQFPEYAAEQYYPLYRYNE